MHLSNNSLLLFSYVELTLLFSHYCNSLQTLVQITNYQSIMLLGTSIGAQVCCAVYIDLIPLLIPMKYDNFFNRCLLFANLTYCIICTKSSNFHDLMIEPFVIQHVLISLIPLLALRLIPYGLAIPLANNTCLFRASVIADEEHQFVKYFYIIRHRFNPQHNIYFETKHATIFNTSIFFKESKNNST